MCVISQDTEDKEKEKTKTNRQQSQEKESNKPPAPRDTRVSSGGSTTYEVPPVKGNDPIRIQCREMLIKSLKLDNKPGMKIISTPFTFRGYLNSRILDIFISCILVCFN